VCQRHDVGASSSALLLFAALLCLLSCLQAFHAPVPPMLLHWLAFLLLLSCCVVF